MDERMTIRGFGILTLSTALFFGGCSKDSSSSPVDSGPTVIPTVAPTWSGSGTTSGGVKYVMSIILAQTTDKVSGVCVWRSQSSGVSCVKYYDGTIAATRKLNLAGYKSSGTSDWQLDNWAATLSASGDSLTGTFAVPSTSSLSGTFELAKMSSAPTFPTASGNWTGVVQQGVGTWGVTVTFTQILDVLVGDWVYTGPNIKTTSIGTVTANRSINLKEIAVEYSDPRQASQWTLVASTAFTLSAKGDTISGTWLDNYQKAGTALLVKK
jgi:hypothetical protein